MRKRTFVATALFLTLLAPSLRAQEPVDLYPQAAKGYAVAVDDKVVWAKGFDTPRAPASLTKLLSALVILDHPWNPDATVTVSARAASAEGSRIGLRAGDKVRAGDLLTGMIVRSGNDSCMAMAEQVGGSAERFVQMMNAKAQQIGMHDSHFINPCGLDAEGHVSTPRDLLTLARVAADKPEIAERANELRAEFRTLGGRRIRIRNTNAILGKEPDVRGLKTGFTNHAGKCLIALAERGAHKVWIVLLHSPNRWFMASDLMNHGLAMAESASASTLK